MNRRRRTWLLIAAFGLLAPTTALAQPGRRMQPSHLPLKPDPNMAAVTKEILDARLNQSREAHALEKVPDLLQRLMKDPEFLKALQKNLTPEQEKQLAKIGQDLVKGKSPMDNPEWSELLKGLRSNEGDLKQVLKEKIGDDAGLLKRWAEKQPDLGKLTGGAGNRGRDDDKPSAKDPLSEEANGPPAGQASLVPGSSQPPPAPTLWDRMEQKSTSWFKEHANDWAKDMDEWADSPLGNSLRNALRRAGQHRPGSGDKPFDLADKTRGLTDRLGKLGQYLPTERLRSLDLAGRLRNIHLPRLPSGGMTGASLASVPRASGAGVVSGLLWALVLLTLGVVLWKSLRWYREEAANGDGWKLGPWPVRPESFATRADLVRAFEHLALLCLGPVALACNHLDLAARLGSSEGTDFEKQRAAENLAALYEQARYAPPDEALRPEELAAARRDLCLLAGVGAA